MRPYAEQTCLVTGATQGIGKEIARALATRGVRLIITARDASRGAAVVEELKAATGNGRIELALVDFASFASVRAFLDDVRGRVDRLDVLVNNAGAFYNAVTTTVDGLEATFQVNHLGYFATTLGLLEKLRAAGDARVVCVSSDAYAAGAVDFSRLGHVRGWFGYRAYGASKLMNILFAREGARRFPPSVAINAMHPGMVRSGFALGGPAGPAQLFYKAAGALMRSPTKGAETAVWLATAPELAGVTGKYFANRREHVALPVTRDAAVARRLWEESERLLAGAALP